MSSNRSKKKLKIDPNAIRQQVSYSVSEEQKLTYNYRKWGNSNGWKTYPSPITLVESSDCCFMEREVFNWMTSLRYGKII